MEFNEDFDELFRRRLKEVRKEKSLSQKEMASLLNISRQAISGYESGISHPSLQNLVLIADTFGISLDYLLCRTDYMQNPFTSERVLDATIKKEINQILSIQNESQKKSILKIIKEIINYLDNKKEEKNE